MSESIDKRIAEKTLFTALNNKCERIDTTSLKIEAILRGSHKTYKYILINGLLAKATNPNINPIALQASAPIIGAFDARSLCHHVLVPFERDYLNSALGGSNEPFLNKPARVTHLSMQNAVRRGSDRQTLETVIEIFQVIQTQSDAESYLICALQYLKSIAASLELLHNAALIHNPTLNELYEFINRLVHVSNEGESAVIVVATLERVNLKRLSNDFLVKPHKVNQSGASSKESADIDVFKNEKYVYGIEVKDKNFTEHDLSHALKKMRQSGALKGCFIYGPKAQFEANDIGKKLKELEKAGFFTFFTDIFSYSKFMLSRIEFDDYKEFAEELLKVAIEINCKDATKKMIQDLFKELNWK